MFNSIMEMLLKREKENAVLFSYNVMWAFINRDILIRIINLDYEILYFNSILPNRHEICSDIVI